MQLDDLAPQQFDEYAFGERLREALAAPLVGLTSGANARRYAAHLAPLIAALIQSVAEAGCRIGWYDGQSGFKKPPTASSLIRAVAQGRGEAVGSLESFAVVTFPEKPLRGDTDPVSLGDNDPTWGWAP